MGRTFVDAIIHGPADTRRYSFFVDTGSALMGLPLEEIEALGLPKVPDGQAAIPDCHRNRGIGYLRHHRKITG